MTLYLKCYQKYGKSKLKTQILLSEFSCFNFDMSHLFMPLEAQVHSVPHLKDLVKNETGKLSSGSTFNNCQDVLKITHLLNKRGFVDSQLLRTILGLAEALKNIWSRFYTFKK